MNNNDLTQSKYNTPVAEFSLYMPEDSPQTARYAHPAYEPVATQEFSKHLNKQLDDDLVFYDIGSRYGPYTVISLIQGVRPENIHTFEMNKRAYDSLNCTLEERGIRSKVHTNNREVGNSEALLRLDDYVGEGNNPPDILKMDIEGAEYPTLLGFSDTITEEKPYMMIELHPWRLIENFDSHPDQVIDLVREWGYNIQVCLSQREKDSKWNRIEDINIDPEGHDHTLMCIPEQ